MLNLLGGLVGGGSVRAWDGLDWGLFVLMCVFVSDAVCVFVCKYAMGGCW